MNVRQVFLLVLCQTAFSVAGTSVRGPEAWLEFMGGNVRADGLRCDLEAIKAAGISGVQFFHIDRGGPWPDCPEQIRCMSGKWDGVISFLGAECRRLGLKLTVQNCPGWSQSGGPWIAASNAMREVRFVRKDMRGGTAVDLPPVPTAYRDADSDWRDIAVLAFPTPLGDDGRELKPLTVKTNGFDRTFVFAQPVTIRSAVIPGGLSGFNPDYVYHAPWMHAKLEAVCEDGSTVVAFDTDFPMSSWRDYVESFTIACSEQTAREWRYSFAHRYPVRNFREPKFFAAARQTDWEAKSALVLRSLPHEPPRRQSAGAWIGKGQVVDLTARTLCAGRDALRPGAPGKMPVAPVDWTVLRIGHVNSKRVNAPAPPEATGWECDKLAPEGIEASFSGYVKRLTDGPLKGRLDGILVDSWECFGQTWTPRMEKYFAEANGYSVRPWLPALFGWVVESPAATERFLTDWRRTVGDLITRNYYGRLAELAHAHNLTVQFETAFGDIIPGDLLEYWKYADEPMCEFWLPHTSEAEGHVGSYAFKPIRPCASAAHIYGKRRVTAEAFTGWGLSWREDFREMRDVANRHFARGVTHLALQSYTHAPSPNAVPPGGCMGGYNGTPFTRLQTWWRHMPEFTGWLTRCEERLEEGQPAEDVLWYLGDAVDHKPDECFAFPEGYRADYLNHDALTNRLSVKDGRFAIPEGATWRVLWVPDERFIRPATQARLKALAAGGGTVVFGDKEALKAALANLTPDVATASASSVSDEDIMWIHRRVGDLDRYFVAAGTNGWRGRVTFRAKGAASVCDPVTEERYAWTNGTELQLVRSQSVFVEFGRPAKSRPKAPTEGRELGPWTLSFEPGWGAPPSVRIDRLVSWTELDGLSEEGRAYSGTATYETTFALAKTPPSGMWLDLGRVETIAKVWVNGRPVRTLWCEPYVCDISSFVREGANGLRIEVTNTWLNRVLYDLRQPVERRKTWIPNQRGLRSKPTDPPIAAGLLGPVCIR